MKRSAWLPQFSTYNTYGSPVVKAGPHAVLLARWIVRSVPLEIVGSSGHEKVATRGKSGLERPGRPRGENIVRQALVNPTVIRSTIRADVGVAIVPQTTSRHLAEANLKLKCPFRALQHRQLRLQWCQDTEPFHKPMWNVTDWKKVVFSDESRFVLGTDDNRVRVWRRPEHVWDQLKRHMPSCHSVHDLELAVQDLWAHLPQDNIRCLINSMPDRVAACIAAGGGPTRY
ncbi:transposable element Tcb2 transposase [Trichonephila clavipes]|nr:transposable element Tcb2 transposase [Trichonephila clavipes]